MKGISEIVSVALLLAVGVAVAGIYAEWAPGFAANITQTAADQSSADMRCDNAAITLRNLEYSESGNLVFYEAHNIGTIRFTGELNILAIESSRIVANSSFTGLNVEETRSGNLQVDEKPDQMIISSVECPDVDDRSENIGGD